MKMRILKEQLTTIRKFVGEIETLQTVCIIAIAATVVISATRAATEGRTWMETDWNQSQSESIMTLDVRRATIDPR